MIFKSNMNKKWFIFLILFFFYKYTKNITIYQCSRYTGRYEQCLNKWIDSYGNTRMDLWKCPTNKYCQILSRGEVDNTIGVCTYNYKKKYDQDYCSYNSECSSFTCIEGKCVGFSENELCQPGAFQCKNNLVCRKSIELFPYNEQKEVYKCRKLSLNNEECENDNECHINLVCTNKNIIKLINNSIAKNISELKNDSLIDEYISIKNKSKKVCVQRASLENGLPTDDAMACKSGDVISIEIFPNYNETICVSKIEIIEDCNNNNYCIIKVNLGKFGDNEIKQKCIFTTRGNPLCPLAQKEKAWNNYISTFANYYSFTSHSYIVEADYHIPAHKYTFNALDLSQSYWKYSNWMNYTEADSCTQQFFFLMNRGIIINYSFLNIFIYFILLYI